MENSWPEVKQAAAEERRELVLTGAEIAQRVEKNGLDALVFRLANLNFLEVSKTALTEISEDLTLLHNLNRLVLHHNKLTKFPLGAGKLSKLKHLDLSNNKIESLPHDFGEISELQSLNVSCNKMKDFPNIGNMGHLLFLDISHNELDVFPDGICNGKLDALNQVNASNNSFTEMPDDFSSLPQLKNLDLSNNKITAVPPELCECPRLKELNLKGNKLKDRRLGKMTEQCATKSIIDYLRTIYEKENKSGKTKDKKRKKKKSHSEKSDEEVLKNTIRVMRFQEEGGVEVRVGHDVAEVRPYIVCCVVRHLNFHKSNNMFKRFIALQTKLHEGICQKRQSATIATHDLNSVRHPLNYQAGDPTAVKLTPLFKSKPVSAAKLVAKLVQEAEEVRKEKRRNTVTGIHKYLDLLKGKSVYPFLVDSDGEVLSFPPITNCDISKVSKDTRDILIEVTSTLSLDTCKKVMDSLIQNLLEMNVGQDPEKGDAATEAVAEMSDDDDDDGAAGGVDKEGFIHTSGQRLVVEQVKVIDAEGGLRVLYPSRVDLMLDDYRVERPQ